MHFLKLCWTVFQSTLRRTERQRSLFQSGRIQNFNPRSDERSDGFQCVLLMRLVIFQSTLRRTERQCMHRCRRCRHYFNPRSDERSDVLVHLMFGYLVYFNPRSDERSDLQFLYMLPDVPISIHAPTNGATACWQIIKLFSHISIHAPTNGATICSSYSQASE